MIYVCSDIHGHYDAYTALLAHIDLKSDDTLYIPGDVIDREPDGVKILQDMMARPNIVPILGNHEFTAAVCLPGAIGGDHQTEFIRSKRNLPRSHSRVAYQRRWSNTFGAE